MSMAEIAIIGGSGVYQIEGVKIIQELDIDTPFGKPSDKIMIAEIEGKEVAFLPRHGKGHRILPGELPVEANVWALKSIGVRKVIAVSAVGSLKEKIKPRDFVIPSQIIDRTKNRPLSLFGKGVVGHVSFADPFCPHLSESLYQTLKKLNLTDIHRDAAYVCMEGPQFSTKAESNLYRSWDADIIGMTAIPEAKMFREAEICYAMIALSTDYDCWHEEIVTVEMVIGNMKSNVENIKKALPDIIKNIEIKSCGCEQAAAFAIMTDKTMIPQETKQKLSLFYKKYWD
ncbi:MAG TPA: S-methyl-5'-thioadenosine phosphorylase [Spirochaetia bacterium]|nr:S-methyl-5'-thioadenosine phosphorylase [Spirochaetia bacterium]